MRDVECEVFVAVFRSLFLSLGSLTRVFLMSERFWGADCLCLVFGVPTDFEFVAFFVWDLSRFALVAFFAEEVCFFEWSLEFFFEFLDMTVTND